MKKLLSYSVFCTSIILSTSFCKFNWVGLNLSKNDITNCVNFQLTRGANCIADFEKLKPVLDKFISNKYTIERLPEILGEPNKTIDQTNFVYNLNANTSGCIAILRVRNNELVSYEILGCK